MKALFRRPERSEGSQKPLALLLVLCLLPTLTGCAQLLPEGAERRAGEQLLYHVGRYIYLTDALEDAEEDRRRGRYNPMLLRYDAAETGLRPEDRRSAMETIDASVSMAAAALELMPLRSGDGILRNIVYLGMPAVLRSVADGTGEKRGSHL